MSPKLFRLLFVAMVVTGFSAPMLGASAAGQPRTVDAYNPPRNFEAPGPTPTNRLEVAKDDTVSWIIWEGEHTVTPKDAKQWGGDGSDPNAPLTQDSPRYSKVFTKPGDYVYFCSIHGGIGEDGKEFGMYGVVHVKDPNANNTPPPPPPPPPTTQPPTTQPPTTTPTRPGATPPATTATAPTTRPAPTGPAPTATTTKPDRGKKSKDETTTTTIPPLTPPPPPIDLPDEAIIPTLPGAGATSSAEPGANAEAPANTPEGEAVALLKAKKNNGGEAMKLLIVSGLGLGALGVGTAGYKYANRSSKYFPA